MMIDGYTDACLMKTLKNCSPTIRLYHINTYEYSKKEYRRHFESGKLKFVKASWNATSRVSRLVQASSPTLMENDIEERSDRERGRGLHAESRAEL